MKKLEMVVMKIASIHVHNTPVCELLSALLLKFGQCFFFQFIQSCLVLAIQILP